MGNHAGLDVEAQVEAIVAAELAQQLNLDALLAARVTAALPEMMARFRVLAAARTAEHRQTTCVNAQPRLMRELLMNRLAQAS